MVWPKANDWAEWIKIKETGIEPLSLSVSVAIFLRMALSEFVQRQGSLACSALMFVLQAVQAQTALPIFLQQPQCAGSSDSQTFSVAAKVDF